ncbi:MAG: hypothetical protein V7672_11855 [Brevundimonas sp.]|uniref:hypothetical protein n=1 Tax=Brevundimonas sp. TaxID=1871086 RepID=UPI003002F4AA
MIENTCKSLAERLEAKRVDGGLVDIKFYIKPYSGCELQDIYDEVDALLNAVDDPSRVEDFAFGDRRAS